MKDLFDKISSYNLFNYLLPGILFAVIANFFTTFSFIQEDIVLGAFVYYFIGLVISRFGSLIVEPFLKRISFVKFADYKDFISASKKDPKIELLSEGNNTYRTLSAMFILLLLLKLYDLVEVRFPLLRTWNSGLFIVIALCMFLCSYRKQTEYIKKRITATKGK